MCSKLQEIDKSDKGRVPRTIEIELTHDLVGSCRAGDVVTVLGLVKVMNTETEPGLPCRSAQAPMLW